MYVSNTDSSTVNVISGTSSTPVASIPLSAVPDGIAYDPSNGYMYVTTGGYTVSMISGISSTIAGTVTVGFDPTQITYDPSNGDMYVSDYEGSQVSIISGLTPPPVATTTTHHMG